MSLKGKLFLVVCLVFVAAVAVGSNMAFKLNYTLLTNVDNNNINWVSLPYFDNYTVSEDVCVDINTVDCTMLATSIAYFDTATNSTVTHTCGFVKSYYNIFPGRGYAISVMTDACTWKIVGSHNDAYDTTLGISFLTNTYGNNINWVSVPYHSTATVAEGLCTQINANCANIATSIASFDTATNSANTHGCGTTKNNFSVAPGRAYAVSVSAAGNSCWHPAHY